MKKDKEAEQLKVIVKNLETTIEQLNKEITKQYIHICTLERELGLR